ncbi:hypothetical protein OQX61_23940 [Pedobacter sp. PLR]|uniref:hypothetical protein n=1 Tax=Pedobacter sp. PLR TaxID=2994465 RepID=UPI002246293F|nr:hypothetical protein [Pedobacter sp. PLR]MCX2454343.1 hypothetical protein [Pedobacter sp. PLR]
MEALKDFAALCLPEKIRFFDDAEIQKFFDLDDIQLNGFFKNIVLDEAENDYVKKKALGNYVDVVLLNKIKPRQALGLFVDDWKKDGELFLELERLKTVFIFHELEPDSIEEIYNAHLLNYEGELAAESSLRLGMIQLQKGMLAEDRALSLKYFSEGYALFTKSDQIIENRIDARIYALVSSTLIDLMDSRTGAIDGGIQQIGAYLFQMQASSFADKEVPLYLGLYRILLYLSKITNEDPDNWLNFREGLRNLHHQYALIENENLSKRLSEGVLSESFRTLVQQKMLKPYFVLNFSAQVSKIKSRIIELGDEEEASFLRKLLNYLSEEGVKKKIEKAAVKAKLSQIFADRGSANIDAALSGITDYSDAIAIMKVCEQLSSPSLESFKDHLIAACLKMQGNRKYWSGYSEDDRNTFIANLLEAYGYLVKDQTRWSTSAQGKSAGEIDLFVCESNGVPFTIIEALNLDSLKQDYLILHLDKLFNYDANGNKANFILIYSDVKDFSSFCSRYLAFVSGHTYEYPLVRIMEVNDYSFIDIRIIESAHTRNNAETLLYHVLIDLKKN